MCLNFERKSKNFSVYYIRLTQRNIKERKEKLIDDVDVFSLADDCILKKSITVDSFVVADTVEW